MLAELVIFPVQQSLDVLLTMRVLKKRARERKSTFQEGRVRTTARTNRFSAARSKTRTKMKVLVAHYASIIVRGICSVIADSDDFEVCAKTSDAEKARELFEFHRPRVVIVGRAVGGRDGIDLIKQFHKMDSKTAILMMCASEDAESVHRVWRAGALGYLRTMDSDEELVRAMRNTVAGERYVSDRLRQVVFKRVATGRGKLSGVSIDKLSDRERQVFFQIGKGARLSEIASQIRLSSRTIEEFQRRIKAKLGLSSTIELREKAARWANKRDWERAERSMAEAIA